MAILTKNGWKWQNSISRQLQVVGRCSNPHFYRKIHFRIGATYNVHPSSSRNDWNSHFGWEGWKISKSVNVIHLLCGWIYVHNANDQRKHIINQLTGILASWLEVNEPILVPISFVYCLSKSAISTEIPYLPSSFHWKKELEKIMPITIQTDFPISCYIIWISNPKVRRNAGQYSRYITSSHQLFKSYMIKL